mgnify:CR=1 FL=1
MIEEANRALIQAFENENLDQVRHAIERGADARVITPAHFPPRAETEAYIDILRYLFAQGTDVNNTAFGEGIAMTFAAYRRQLRYLQLFVDVGGDVNLAQPANGVTGLHVAVQHNLPDVVQFFIDAGANINQACYADAPTSDPGHVYGETALHFAAAGADKEIIEQLLLAGADKTALSSSGETPLQYALSPERPHPIRPKVPKGETRSEDILQLLR